MSAPTPRQLRDTVKWFTLSEELAPKGALVLAATSGGPDSMALLSLLHDLGRELGFRVAAAYLDHRIRPSGDDERRLVEGYAARLGVPFYAGAADVPAEARHEGDSIEEAARKARYRFLQGITDDIRADRIATGHTRTDQAETVLMRVLRGTGLRGLTGIRTRRGRIIRPLLCLNRADTRGYCDMLAVPYTNDPSNTDVRFARNRIRHELFPLLEASYHPAVEDNLLRLAQNAQEVIQHIRSETGPLIEKNLRELSPERWSVNISQIARLDDTSLVVLFSDIFAEHLMCDMDFGRVHYESLLRLVKDARASGKQLSLPGLAVKREYENLLIHRPTAGSATARTHDYRATLTFPGETRAAGYVVTTEIVDGGSLDARAVKATDGAAFFALGELTLPLVLRNPASGDRMQPFGMQGTKKLSDIFVDKKIPGHKRAESLVVTDADEIVWLVGVTTSERSRVATNTNRVVKITIRPEPPGESPAR